MNDKREMLRHFLATLAYRVSKALRGAPPDFPAFRAGAAVRTPHELICHMTNVLGYARTHFVGGHWPSRIPSDFQTDVRAFHEMLADLSERLRGDQPLLDTSEERLLQGPFSDAMTHAGQLAMLRRLAGSPIRPEKLHRRGDPCRQCWVRTGRTSQSRQGMAGSSPGLKRVYFVGLLAHSPKFRCGFRQSYAHVTVRVLRPLRQRHHVTFLLFLRHTVHHQELLPEVHIRVQLQQSAVGVHLQRVRLFVEWFVR